MRACKKSAPYYPIWPHLASFGPFGHVSLRRLFLALFGPFWPRLTQCGPVWPCLAQFGIIWHHLAPFGPVRPCLATLQFWFQGTLRYQFAKVATVVHATSVHFTFVEQLIGSFKQVRKNPVSIYWSYHCNRPGKSCKRCKRRLRTFCQKSCYFEDILSQISRTFEWGWREKRWRLRIEVW